MANSHRSKLRYPRFASGCSAMYWFVSAITKKGERTRSVAPVPAVVAELGPVEPGPVEPGPVELDPVELDPVELGAAEPGAAALGADASADAAFAGFGAGAADEASGAAPAQARSVLDATS